MMGGNRTRTQKPQRTSPGNKKAIPSKKNKKKQQIPKKSSKSSNSKKKMIIKLIFQSMFLSLIFIGLVFIIMRFRIFVVKEDGMGSIHSKDPFNKVIWRMKN